MVRSVSRAFVGSSSLTPNTPRPTSQTWVPLGYISNEKPSAIFKVGQHPTRGVSMSNADVMEDEPLDSADAQPLLARLGISIEPLETCVNLVPASRAGGSLGSAASGTDLVMNTDADTVSSSGIVTKIGVSDAQVIGLKLLENLFK
ncbi:hypothetical protein HDU83_007707 [Entophlyctis luteolus]|nr:hypothetical protein HDU83_007707 [Entophlyctis luteolus]KAJ3379732.1 hypothetical protein HDU84_006443 [Entophlyctis sp. JEL0112]